MSAAKNLDSSSENESGFDSDESAGVSSSKHSSSSKRSLEKSGKAFQLSEQDIGPADRLRSTILTLTFDEQYDRAVSELKTYVANKTALPAFERRVSRYVKHCMDLIQAIKIKRSVQGTSYVAKSKEQDLTQRVHQHFDELKQSLLRIERIERQLRLDDLRSTVWVLRAFVYSAFLIVVAYIWEQISAGSFHSLRIFLNSELSKLVDLLTSHLKL